MKALVKALDWSQTSLGSRETWPPALQMAVDLLLENSFPLLLWWGPDYISIYNDAYRPVLGTKHPWALGKPFREVWSEVRHILEPLIDAPFHGGPATWMDDIPLEINRHDFVEESHFTIAYSPVPDSTAPRGIGGVLAMAYEITEKIVAERRVEALRDLGRLTVEAKTAEEAASLAMDALGAHPEEVPFAALYLFDKQHEQAQLVAATGVEPGAPAAPLVIFMDHNGDTQAPWPAAELLRSDGMIVVDHLAQRLQKVPPGCWQDPPHTAIVLPIRSNTAHQAVGMFVAGVSPRLKLDKQYEGFFELLGSQLASIIATARAYEEERKRAEALAEIDRAKTLFFSNISHEFRTPLTLMLGPLEDALADPLPAVQRDRVEVAHRNSLRLIKLVNSLLDFARIEAGRAQATYEALDLSALTTELASNFRSACDRAGLQLIVDCAPLPESMYVDHDMWEKIVLNLLSNAFKFTFEGEIVVRLKAVNGAAELSVHDTGVGIPKHEMPRLFDRFHRIEGQKSRTYEGSGIGLALVQELVKLHSGSIRVESEFDRGTAFTVAIPFGRAHLPADRIGAERNLGSPAVRADSFVQEALRWLPDAPSSDDRMLMESSVDAGGNARNRVLIADDNADMRAYLRTLLALGFDVETVSDGEAALKAMRQQKPDLLIADVMMPRLDGMSLVRAIRADAELRDLPIIMLSARAGEESKVEGLRAGVDDYLAKPFSARELIARVAANLKLARVRREGVEALRKSEEQLRAHLTASFDVVYWMNADWTVMRHLEGKQFIEDTAEPNATWLEKYIRPDDQAQVMGAIRHAITTKSLFELEHRVLRADGTYGWTSSRAVPLLDDHGEIVEWLGTAADITAQKQHDERQNLLLNELNHRVKNTLAAVQFIAAQTLRDAPSTADARVALQSRLMALASAHDVLTRQHWEGADIYEVIRGALAAYRTDGQEHRLQIDGPNIHLIPRAALALSLAIHELATNAAKYGALSNEGGCVHIHWQLTDTPQTFSFAWVESGGPPVNAPQRRGFGSRLIERGLAQDLSGQIELEFKPAGVVCSISAPIEEIANYTEQGQ
jgi:signal transduction histidine kinase/FixJ family two-component response regulator